MASAATATAEVEERLLTGWGRTAATRARFRTAHAEEEAAAALSGAGPRGIVPRGLGRSYGDAAQNAGGDVVATTGMSGVRALDARAGRVVVGAGTPLSALTDAVLAHGWFPPVVPGTGQVTVGGAIACDVHGKNHHVDGSIGRHVESLVLLAPTGERLVLRPGDPAFAATAGGMGLTGVIAEATLRLTPVETAQVRAHTQRAGDLDALMGEMAEGDERFRYSVAWIDLLARGTRLGRSVLLRGDHARREDLPTAQRRAPLAPAAAMTSLAAPAWVPGGLLRRATVRAFNEAWFRRAPREPREELEPLRAFFHPLDGVEGWNRLYGARGLVQYQFVVPFGREDTLRAVVERLAAARVPSFLAVLKRMGAEGGPLAFPRPGWTLALDLPAGLPGLAALLDGLDALVAEAGGRVYLAKDSRLRPELLETMYPRLPEWRAARDQLDPRGVMRSDLARRIGL